MRYLLLGGAGFIGTNLAIRLTGIPNNKVTIVDADEKYFEHIEKMDLHNVSFRLARYNPETDFDDLVQGQETVFHLWSATIPGNSNNDIAKEIEMDVISTARLLEAAFRQDIKKVVFMSSGGTVYGKKGKHLIREDMVTYPISSYGIQKTTIEKLLYLYRYQKGLDYRVIRLSNPYGPYQRPDGRLGVVTTFVYKALNNEPIKVYGDGSVVRDFIYIDDAIDGILRISDGVSEYRTFNLGSGVGTSINEIIELVKEEVNSNLKVEYIAGRSADVPVNYLDMARFKEEFGDIHPRCLRQGIRDTATFLKEYYVI